MAGFNGDAVRPPAFGASYRVPKTAHRKTYSYQLPKNIVDLFRQTFAGLELSSGAHPKSENRSLHTDSSSHRKSRKKSRTKPPHLNGYECFGCDSMNNKPHRKLPDARYTFSPPPMSHLTDRGDKYGARYGSAGDVSTGARDNSDLRYTNVNDNNPIVPGREGNMDGSITNNTDVNTDSQADTDSECSSSDRTDSVAETKVKEEQPKTDIKDSEETAGASTNVDRINADEAEQPDELPVIAGSDGLYTDSTEQPDREVSCSSEPYDNGEVDNTELEMIGQHKCCNRPSGCSVDKDNICKCMQTQTSGSAEATLQCSAVKTQTDKSIETTEKSSVDELMQTSDDISDDGSCSDGEGHVGEGRATLLKEPKSYKAKPPVALPKRQENGQSYLKSPLRERPTAADESEDDFFEKLFLSSLELMSDETDGRQNEPERNQTAPNSQEDEVFEELFTTSQRIISESIDKRHRTTGNNLAAAELSADNKPIYNVKEDNTEVEGASGIINTGPRHGILQRTPSGGRRHVNVHFDNEVSTETFSQTDEESSPAKALLAHGDGPPNNIPGTSIPLPPPVPDIAQASGPGMSNLIYATDVRASEPVKSTIKKFERSHGKGPLDYVKAKILKKFSNGSKYSSEVVRKDSMPKAVSPTDLLRQKQKSVTDKIIKETNSQKPLLSSASGKTGSLPSLHRNVNNQLLEYMVRNEKDLQLTEEKSDKEKKKGNDVRSNDSQDMSEKNLKSSDLNSEQDKQQQSPPKYFVIPDKGNGKKDLDVFEGIDICNMKVPNLDFKEYQTSTRQSSEKSRQESGNQQMSHKEQDNSTQGSEGGGYACEQSNVRGVKETADKSPEPAAVRNTAYSQQMEKSDDRKRSFKPTGSHKYSDAIPSKLFQKIQDREKSKTTYTTPSELFKIKEDREKIDKSSESINTSASTSKATGNESLIKTSSEEQPGYWFFKRESNTRQSGNGIARHMSGSRRANRLLNEDVSLHANTDIDLDSDKNSELQVGAENNSGLEKRHKNRMKRKSRLDNIEHWTKNNVSSAENINNILNRASSEKKPINTKVSELNCSDISIGSIKESFESVSRMFGPSTDAVDPITMMNELLCDFLALMERKLSQGSAITYDNLRELEFIYDTIVDIGKRLVSQLDEEECCSPLAQHTSPGTQTEYSAQHTIPDTQTEDTVHFMTRSVQTKQYVSWLSQMLESTASLLYSGQSTGCAIGKGVDIIYGRRAVNSSLQSESNDHVNLQIVLCDLGVIRDSLTCLLTEDETDFASITDLRMLTSQTDARQAQVTNDTHDEGPVEVTSEKQNEVSDQMSLNSKTNIESQADHDQAVVLQTEADEITKMTQKFDEGYERQSTSDKHEPPYHPCALNFDRPSPDSTEGSLEYMHPYLGTSIEPKEGDLCDNFTDGMDPFTATYVYLNDFLKVLEEKQECGLAMTPDDCQELDLLYQTIVVISGGLEYQTEDNSFFAEDVSELEDRRDLVSRSSKAQRYADWLTQKLGSTANLLLHQSSSDIINHEETTRPYDLRHERNIYGDVTAVHSCVSLEDIICDLGQIKDSMSCLIMGSQTDFDSITDIGAREYQTDIKQRRYSEAKQRGISTESIPSGYIADTDSKESITTPMCPKDSLLLKQYQDSKETEKAQPYIEIYDAAEEQQYNETPAGAPTDRFRRHSDVSDMEHSWKHRRYSDVSEHRNARRYSDVSNIQHFRSPKHYKTALEGQNILMPRRSDKIADLQSFQQARKFSNASESQDYMLPIRHGETVEDIKMPMKESAGIETQDIQMPKGKDYASVHQNIQVPRRLSRIDETQNVQQPRRYSTVPDSKDFPMPRRYSEVLDVQDILMPRRYSKDLDSHQNYQSQRGQSEAFQDIQMPREYNMDLDSEEYQMPRRQSEAFQDTQMPRRYSKDSDSQDYQMPRRQSKALDDIQMPSRHSKGLDGQDYQMPRRPSEALEDIQMHRRHSKDSYSEEYRMPRRQSEALDDKQILRGYRNVSDSQDYHMPGRQSEVPGRQDIQMPRRQSEASDKTEKHRRYSGVSESQDIQMPKKENEVPESQGSLTNVLERQAEQIPRKFSTASESQDFRIPGRHSNVSDSQDILTHISQNDSSDSHNIQYSYVSEHQRKETYERHKDISEGQDIQVSETIISISEKEDIEVPGKHTSSLKRQDRHSSKRYSTASESQKIKLPERDSGASKSQDSQSPGRDSKVLGMKNIQLPKKSSFVRETHDSQIPRRSSDASENPSSLMSHREWVPRDALHISDKKYKHESKVKKVQKPEKVTFSREAEHIRDDDSKYEKRQDPNVIHGWHFSKDFLEMTTSPRSRANYCTLNDRLLYHSPPGQLFGGQDDLIPENELSDSVSENLQDGEYPGKVGQRTMKDLHDDLETQSDEAADVCGRKEIQKETKLARFISPTDQRPQFVNLKLFKSESSVPGSVSTDDFVESTGQSQLRKKSSVVLTNNPCYIEFDSDDIEDTGSGIRSDGQSVSSPDSCSMHLSEPTTKSDMSSVFQESPKEIRWSAQFRFPEDTSSVLVDLGPSKFTVNKGETSEIPAEGNEDSDEMGDSPERGQRLFGSTQNLDRRGDAGSSKRKPAHPTGRSMTPDTRSYLMEKEVTESQNRKLQMEITTLQTENKLMKEKYNRATAKISELETQLHDAQEDLNTLQESLNKEMAELSARTRTEIDKDREKLESRITALTKDNETLKAEVSSLEKQLDSSHRVTDKARQNSEKTKTLEAHKTEIASLKEELNTVKALLEQSERHLREEEERHGGDSKQLLQLTELKNALQQQADTGGSGMVTDKQLKSLEKRLKVTEERLHQERADRANNLSSVEDKLLTENARLQAVEKEFTRQLHREKDRNRNLEQRLKQVREENEKLRLAMPFDDSVLLSNKDSYDIPYSSHSNQRAETLRISDDLNYILSQIEKQDGLQSGQEEEIIPMLWNKRELAYKQLREYELQLKELRLEDNNIVDGLKNLRDTYGQAESKLKQMEDQVEDTRAQMATLEATYKEQLTQLVQERHEAFARLKTAEDIMAAVRIENEMLRKSLTGHQVLTDSKNKTDSGHSEALQLEVTSLESKVAQLTRQNKLMEGELSTARVQLEARNKALEDAQSELELVYKQIQENEDEDRKQQKIDKLTAQVNSLQIDLKLTTDKYINLNTEKSKLDSEIANLRKTTEAPKPVKHPGTETVDSKVLRELKDSLAEKDGRVSSLTLQLDEAENHLQKTRQDLYIEQEHTAELEAEVETLQHTVNQRAQMFEALSGTEREQHAQYQLLKETLDSVTQELSHKHAQIISLDLNISSQKDRNAELERELYELKQQRSGDGEPDREEVRSGDRLRIHELELERASIKQELSQAYSAIQASEEQFRSLQTENKQLEQEVVKEKTVVLQVTAEKGEIEQHLEELAEEHDSLIQEKNQAEEDLIKLENKLQEILHKYEAEARKQQGNFEKQYGALTPEGKQMASELDSLRKVLEGKEKEVDMLNDKLNRQLIEIDFLNRKVDLVHNDSIANREDVARMISELTLKMKEAVATREVNQFLAGERTKLQTEKNHLERELEQERQNTDKRKIEINEVIKKVETSELQQQSMKKNDQNKTTTIATLEADLRNANQNLVTTQTENTQLKNRLEHLQEDLKNMTAINATLEKRFEMEQNSSAEEKRTVAKWKEDFKSQGHEFELLRHEHVVLGNKLAAEEHAVEKFKKEVQTKDDEISELQEEIRNLKLELDSNKGQLLLTKDTVQKLTQDKGSIYQDYEGLCRSLTDKERQLNEVRDRSEEKVEHIKQEYMSEKLRLENERTTAEKERDIVKQEMNNLNEELKQKEVQLSTFGKTLSDLEAVTRQKNELESLLKQVEGSAGDSKLLLEGQRKELVSLHEALAKQQEETTRLQVTNRTLEMDLRSEKDTSSREIHDLKLTLDELKSQQENERSYLNDNLAQTQTQLRTIEANYASAIEARDSLQAQKRLADGTLEDIQSKLSDESTARRLVEQSVGSLRLQLEDLRNEKTMSDARLVETRNQLTKCEKQLTSEQTKNKKLAGRVQELVTMTESSDANVKSKDEQVEILHKEITKLRQMVDTQKQSLTAKMKKAALEFKQKLDHVQDEKDKLSGQVQKLSTDLDLCREQIASKNKVNLKLQEQIVTLEDCVRDGQTKLKQAQDSLKRESENQSQMSHRYSAQDEELKRLRSFLAKKVEESGEADKSMWHEMNRVIQELSSQMQSHLDAKKSEKGNNSDTQLIQRYKKQLAEVQGDLSTEKSLHQITKTSLKALDEDCTRLRHQLHKLRRRDKSPVADKKYKNRMEAINAIIARSQTQAQALLAAGGYTDDINNSRVHGNPSRGYQSPNRPDSPDNSYASDDLSIASLPPMPFSQYTSQVRSAEAKY